MSVPSRQRRLAAPVAALAAFACLAALPALAQSGKAGAAPPAQKPAAPSGSAAASVKPAKPSAPMGGYSWSDKPRHRRHHHRVRLHFDPNAPIAMFPGFRMLRDGRSLVWVNISRKVPVEVHSAAGRVTYLLGGAQVSIRNNTNALVTTYFDTPLSRARLVPGKQGTQLVLELREKVTPSYKVLKGPGGTMLLQVTLPPPSKSFRPPSALPLRGKSQDRPRSMVRILPAPGAHAGGRSGPKL